MSEQRFEIENVGGVSHIVLTLRPGVSVLSGRNAIGKTSAMRAIVRAQGGKTPLERRDGADHGTVSGPGVKLFVRQVVKATGEAELELADTGPLARLIDPGIKGTEAAARERIKALIELLGLSVDDESLSALCPNDDLLLTSLRKEVVDDAIDDLMVAAERLRHRAHACAREEEDGAAGAKAGKEAAAERCERALEELGGADALVEDESPEEAKEALDSAIWHHGRAIAQSDARVSLEVKQRSIRATLGERPDASVTDDLLTNLESESAQFDSDVTVARRHLELAERALAVVESQIITAKLDIEVTRENTATWDKQDAILREPLTGPTPDEVREQLGLVEIARKRAHAAQLSADYYFDDERRYVDEKEQEIAEKNARRYRELADSIPQRLGEILANAGAPGLTVIDGRLQALGDGFEHKDFEHRCSTGERVALALGVAATAYQGKILPLDGAFWAALDPKTRALFTRIAEERGLFVITEEPTDGELRIEPFSSPAKGR